MLDRLRMARRAAPAGAVASVGELGHNQTESRHRFGIGQAAPAQSGLSDAFIEVRNVAHRYKERGPVILSDLSFTVRRGEIVALVGRSGAGKSTLLSILAGLRLPESGRVVVNGEPVLGPLPSRILMAQQPALFPWMTVAQNVGLGLRFSGRRAEASERVAEALALVELSDFAAANVQDLSGGQQQRAALARALAPGPELLLLDEPFSALDQILREQLQRLVRDLARSRDITMVVITHDLSEAALLADRVLVLPNAAAAGMVEIPVALDETHRIPGHPAIAVISDRITETLRCQNLQEEALASAQL